MFQVAPRSLASKRPSLKQSSLRSKLLSVGHWPFSATATMDGQQWMANASCIIRRQRVANGSSVVSNVFTKFLCPKFQDDVLLLPSYRVSTGTLSLTRHCNRFRRICSLVKRFDLPNSRHDFPKPKNLGQHSPGLNRFLEKSTGMSRRDSWFDPKLPAKQK